MSFLDGAIAMLEHTCPQELRGSVVEVRGLALHVAALPLPVGAMVAIHAASGRGGGRALAAAAAGVPGEVVGFRGEITLVMPLGPVAGIGRGDAVVALQHTPMIRVGHALLGRVLDGLGNPIDGLGPLQETVPRAITPPPLDPLKRPSIEKPLATGVRAIDAMMPVGRGQRLGVFAGPGCGKSTLLGTMARHTAADVTVIGLIGERGREVRDFIDKTLGPDGLTRSVVVCATGDEPAVLRLRAAMTATTVAEYFRDQGLNVLLLMDSVTRFCQAQRQIGLAAGEPPATKGFPPSVFAMLPVLLERSGQTDRGSITGFYTVLVEGDDMTEPVADACRGVLDGHILLDRKLAERGHYPAIDVLGSISRVADEVTDREHQACRREVVKLLASYRQVEDLLNIGAYAQGANPDFDLAIACRGNIEQLLLQGRGEVKGLADFQKTRAQLLALMQVIQKARQDLARGGAAVRRPPPMPVRR